MLLIQEMRINSATNYTTVQRLPSTLANASNFHGHAPQFIQFNKGPDKSISFWYKSTVPSIQEADKTQYIFLASHKVVTT